jgi:RNA polymerase sigma factor (sigma-70 family)
LTDLFLNAQSDERLVGLVRAGHERAFATIVLRYRRSLHGLARRLASDGTAEDVVQQTFLSAYEALQSGAEVQHLSGWLHRILHNTAIRSGSRAPAAAELDAAALSGEPLEESVQRRQQAFALFAELAALPARQREALVATALPGHSREAIAASTGVSEGAVRQLVHRARATLRTAVTALTPCPVASWFVSGPDALPSDQLGEAAVGAGGMSLAGAGLKLGALMASAAVATGVAGSQRPVHHLPAHHRPRRAMVPGARTDAVRAATVHVRARERVGARGVETRVVAGAQATAGGRAATTWVRAARAPPARPVAAGPALRPPSHRRDRAAVAPRRCS